MGNGWHLDKRVSVGHIVTTAVVAISVIMYLMQLDSRVSVLEQIAAQHAERFDRTDQRWSSELAVIRRILERIDEKLERKADRER